MRKSCYLIALALAFLALIVTYQTGIIGKERDSKKSHKAKPPSGKKAAHKTPESSRTPSLSRNRGRTLDSPWKGRSKPKPKSPQQQIQVRSKKVVPQKAQVRSKNFLDYSNSRDKQRKVPSDRQKQFNSSLGHRREKDKQDAKRSRDRIRKDHPQSKNWFDDNFFDRHQFNRFWDRRGVNWWHCPSWSGVINWLPWGWQDPYYYYDDYGYPSSRAYLNYERDRLYNELSAQAQGYSQLPERDRRGTPEAVQGDWLSLGVFAAGNNASQAAYSTMFFQLALSKDGRISGSYYNSATDELFAIDGTVDQETQKAIWTFSEDEAAPLMMTGLYNLTQDVAPITVHFPDDTSQNWVLVRMEQ